MPRTLRKNVVHFNPEVLIYECELIDNQIHIQQPAITPNKQNRWGMLEAIKTGVQYGFVQINNTRHRLFKFEGKFYMLIENKNRDKVPDGQKIQGKLIAKTDVEEQKVTEKKHKHKTKITYLDKEDSGERDEKPEIDGHASRQAQHDGHASRQAERDEGKRLKISMSPMTYSAILPEFDAVIVPESQPWQDFELI